MADYGVCPNCGYSDFHYDNYEDMWTCLRCIKGDGVYIFSPEEVGFLRRISTRVDPEKMVQK